MNGTGKTDPMVPEEKGGVLTRSLAAGQWSLLNTIVQNILTYLTFFVTARVLTPGDFGVIAVAGILPGLLDACTSTAFGTAIIQKHSGEEKPFLNAIWTFDILRTGILALVVFAIAPFSAAFFHSDAYVPLFRLCGLVLLFQNLGNIGQIYFFRELDFRKIFIRDLIWKGTTAALSIGLAFLLHSYWALLIANLTGILASVAMSYVLSPYRPQFDFHFAKLLQLVPFSQWIYGQQLMDRLSRTLEDSVVARYTNPAELGLFSKARGLSTAPITPIVLLINKISFSAYSRIQDSPAQIREGFYMSVDLLIAIAVPFLAAIYVAGNRIILILLGAQWLPSLSYLQILSFAAAIGLLTLVLIGPLFNALGKPHTQFMAQVVYFCTLGLMLFSLVPYFGAYGVSYAMLASSITSGAFSLISLWRSIRYRPARLLGSLMVSAIATMVPLPIGFYLLQSPLANTTLGFIALASAGGLVYFGVLFVFDRLFRMGPFPTLFLILRSVFGKI